MNALPNLPRAVVLCVLGGSLGALSVVRTLGRAGVPVTVVSEDNESLPSASRYCSERFYLENFSVDYDRTLTFLIQYAKKQPIKPLLFPTADPDLKLLSDMREDLKKHYHLVLPERNMVENFMDKRKFFSFASIHDFPVPRTYIPRTIGDVLKLSNEIRYPIVMKPATPTAWTHPEIEKAANYKKAVIASSRNELNEMYEKISKYNNDMIIQEYVFGSDDNHYELLVYMNKKSEPIGFFSGQKIRIYPTYAGGGCFAESVYIDDMVETGIEMLRRVNYSGLADLDFKKDSTTNEMKLLEINPRVTQWNILATLCGVNLPFIAYADTVGIPFTMPQKQTEKIKYVYLKNDVKAFLEYRKNGDWTLWSWLRSLRGKKVYQMYAADDRKPFMVELKRTIANHAQRMCR